MANNYKVQVKGSMGKFFKKQSNWARREKKTSMVIKISQKKKKVPFFKEIIYINRDFWNNFYTNFKNK